MQFSLLDPVTNEVMVFPIAPQSMEVQIGTKKLSFDPILLGSVEIPRGRLPIKFSMSGMFPGENQVVPERESDLNPEEIVRKFKEWSDVQGGSGKKLRFIVTETDWNIPVSFTSFTPRYEGGYGDVFYSLELTEWRDFVVKEIKPQTVTKASVREQKPKPKTYTIKKGDSLWAIARKFAGNGAKWPELWNENKSRLRSGNPNLIYPGETIVIPQGWLK